VEWVKELLASRIPNHIVSAESLLFPIHCDKRWLPFWKFWGRLSWKTQILQNLKHIIGKQTATVV
jgi:hypothetical protein